MESTHPHHPQRFRRYRSNPIEVGIFSVVLLIVVQSIYHLIYDHATFYPSVLTPMSSNPISEGRSLASLPQPLMNLEVECNNNQSTNSEESNSGNSEEVKTTEEAKNSEEKGNPEEDDLAKTAKTEPVRQKLTQLETSANKLRLKGPICGTEQAIPLSSLMAYSIVNTTNQFNATVFTNLPEGQFSTDYIPLAVGENLIHMAFSYPGGKEFSQDIRIVRN